MLYTHSLSRSCSHSGLGATAGRYAANGSWYVCCRPAADAGRPRGACGWGVTRTQYSNGSPPWCTSAARHRTTTSLPHVDTTVGGPGGAGTHGVVNTRVVAAGLQPPSVRVRNANTYSLPPTSDLNVCRRNRGSGLRCRHVLTRTRRARSMHTNVNSHRSTTSPWVSGFRHRTARAYGPLAAACSTVTRCGGSPNSCATRRLRLSTATMSGVWPSVFFSRLSAPALSNALATSALPLDAAKCSAVWPVWRWRVSGTAPRRSRYFTTSCLPTSAAACNGVMFRVVCAESTGTPCSRARFTECKSPWDARRTRVLPRWTSTACGAPTFDLRVRGRLCDDADDGLAVLRDGDASANDGLSARGPAGCALER